jgi:hypothetical protein
MANRAFYVGALLGSIGVLILVAFAQTRQPLKCFSVKGLGCLFSADSFFCKSFFSFAGFCYFCPGMQANLAISIPIDETPESDTIVQEHAFNSGSERARRQVGPVLVRREKRQIIIIRPVVI